MKVFFGTLGLLVLSMSSAFASSGVVDLNVRERHGFYFGRITITGDAARDLYNMMTAIQEVRMQDVPGDGIREQYFRTGDDLVCYKTVRGGRGDGFNPGFPRPGSPQPRPFMPQPGMPLPRPEGPFQPGFVPAPVPVFQPDFRREERATYECQTGVNQNGKIDFERMGRRDDR